MALAETAVEVIGGAGTLGVACATVILTAKYLAPIARDWIAARQGLAGEMLASQREEREAYREQIAGIARRLKEAERRAMDAERRVSELELRLARHESR